MAGIFIRQENSGLIFTNEVKEGEKRPHLSGYINVNGEQFRIALWENEEGRFGAKIQDSDAVEESEEAPAPKKSYGASNGGAKKTFTKPSRR